MNLALQQNPPFVVGFHKKRALMTETFEKVSLPEEMPMAEPVVNGVVFKIKKYALHDGPGIRTSLFLKGCRLSCRWCHNPEGQDFGVRTMAGSRADGGRKRVVGWTLTADQAMTEIEKDVLFYDDSGGGVTFSGGEPLEQHRFLSVLLQKCRQQEIHTAVDTSGDAPRKIFEQVAARADLILFDLKLMDDVDHQAYTGVSNGRILDNFRAACRLQTPLRVRVPLVPGITDTRDNIEMIAEFIRACGAVDQIDLLPYHRIGDDKYRRLGMDNAMAGAPSLSAESVGRIQSLLSRKGFDVNVGG